ncbi:MAG: sulfite exporter TauE/SafE family protein [Phycisphaerae bacterium]
MSFEMLLGVSVVAGFIGAMSGMGGGVVLIPALTLMGVDIKHAIAVSIVSVIATSSGAASAYTRDRITNLRVGMFLEVFTMLGAMAGAAITLVSGQRWLYLAFGVVLLGSWAALLVERRQGGHGSGPCGDGLGAWLGLKGSYYDQAAGKTIEYQATRTCLGGPAMFGAGMIAGLLGIGAGALKVLTFDLIMGLPPKVSTTTSNLIIGVTALAGTSVYLGAGLIDLDLAAPVVLGVVTGAFIGTRLLVRESNRFVRWFFLVVLLAIGLEMLVRGIRGGR